MDPTLKTQIEMMITEAVKNSESFSNRKRGDTPTDMDQLTPKGYVLGQISSVQSSVTGYVTSVVASVNGTINGLTSVVTGLSASVAALPTINEVPNTHFASVQAWNASQVHLNSNVWTFTGATATNYFANGIQNFDSSGSTTAFASLSTDFGDLSNLIIKASIATDAFSGSGSSGKTSFWGFSDSTAAAYGDIANVAQRYGFAFNSGVIYALTADNSTAASTNVYPGYNGETVELGLVYRPGVVDFYINGVLVKTETGSIGTVPARISATANASGASTSLRWGNVVLGEKIG